MPDPDPPPPNYELRARSFEAVNPPVGSTPSAQSIDVQALIRSALTPAANPAPDEPTRAAAINDVQAILQANLVYEASARQPATPPPPRAPSRRTRDYLFCLIVGNSLIAGFIALSGFNLAVLAFGSAGMVVLTLGLTWVMWFVMDDY